jgi:hypothetical protein
MVSVKFAAYPFCSNDTYVDSHVITQCVDLCNKAFMVL